ncbi:hypothetical protein [Actinomycetospora lemnae]|uniref:Integral membrane protein n=1 Tax=Actinomycetospora lemnae TaxID=3019891 RepID=A0ABT5SNL3_9PSEU|nr:hypothetical protein [Actinomycetospora sp. DW7H6]MDD7963736.1 hypothetical protein [Actinomycetospora sp. DW7H6]
MTPPRPVRLAALGVLAEGVVGVVVAALLVAAGVVFSVWGFVVLLAVGLVVVAVALLRGQRGARGPALVAQLLTIGCAFYAAVPSGRPEWGVPVLLAAAVVLYGLLCAPARAWAEQ